MIIEIVWGNYEPPITLQWGNLAEPEEVEQRQDTPNPVAVLVAVNGTATNARWTTVQW